MRIGEKIKSLRQKRGMTQSELSGEDISRNMLSLIEHDRATPSVQTLQVLAERLKVSSAFLLAEAREEQILLRASAISDIRIAFAAHNYHISSDLCKALYEEGIEQDDEVDLILAESLFGNAKDALFSDGVREACRLLDECVFFCSRTVYRTDHLLAAAALYFEYFGSLSPSLISENLEERREQPYEDLRYNGDVYCRYIYAFLDKGPFHCFPSDPPCADLLSSHINAKQYMESGEYALAEQSLSVILQGEDVLPGIIMYHIFSDMETCCRHLENSKNEKLYRDIKLSLLEKLLS